MRHSLAWLTASTTVSNWFMFATCRFRCHTRQPEWPMVLPRRDTARGGPATRRSIDIATTNQIGEKISETSRDCEEWCCEKSWMHNCIWWNKLICENYWAQSSLYLPWNWWNSANLCFLEVFQHENTGIYASSKIDFYWAIFFLSFSKLAQCPKFFGLRILHIWKGYARLSPDISMDLVRLIYFVVFLMLYKMQINFFENRLF